VHIQGHSALLSTVGALLLFTGWLGFNAGSGLAASVSIGHIVVNTILAGAVGGLVALPLGHASDGTYRPERMINGMLAGLVAVTAGCDVVTTHGAMALGAGGSLCAFFGGRLLERLRVDDAVGAVGVHGFSGTFGTVALTLVAPMDALPADTRLGQLGIQASGALIGFLIFNFPPAKIFMGDGGSLVIGFLLAILTARTTYYNPDDPAYALGGGWYGVFMPVIVLAIPLYDLLTVTVIRLKQGRSPFVGDQQHFSHRLVQRGLTKRGAVIVIWAATAVTGIGGIALGSLQPWQAVLVGVQTLLVLLMLALLEHASRHAVAHQR